MAKAERPRSVHRSETFVETFYVFARASVSFKDFPFLKDMIGGVLNRACLMFGTGGSFFLTKDKRDLQYRFLV